MNEQKNKRSTWRLVSMDDLPIPSPREVEEARQRWVDRWVWFSLGADRWRQGKVHGRVIRLEYVPRVLRLVHGK
jgi:hypothetical protein